MSISSDLTRIKNAKSAIITSITNKGVTVPSGTKIDGLAPLINKIQTGATRQTVSSLGYANKAYVFAFDGQYPYGGYAKPSSTANLGGLIDLVNGVGMSIFTPNSSGANYWSTIGKNGSTTTYTPCTVGCHSSGYALTQTFTIEITFSFVDSLVNNAYNYVWALEYDGNTTTLLRLLYNSGLKFYYGNSDYTILSSSEVKVGSKYCVQIRSASDKGFDIFVNGVRKYHSATAISLGASSNRWYKFTLGSRNTSKYNYYSLRAFAGWLTDAELTQNYNRDKARFGIT